MTAGAPILSIDSGRLPFRTKLIYGLANWGITTTSTLFIFFFSFFLTDIARLDPLFAAPVLLLGGIWDAINDPLIGMLADRVRTRWGRRRPLIFLGAFPLAIFFILMWLVPPWQSQLALASYYLLMYLLFDTSLTLVMIPYSALTAELTEDYDERTGLTAYRMATSMAGGLVAAVALPLVVDLFPERRTGYWVVALAFGILSIVPYMILCLGIREKTLAAVQAPLSVVSGFLYTIRNRAFRYAAGVYMTAWIAVNLVAALMQYYMTYWMRMGDQIEVILGLVQASALVCIPLMAWLARRMGKQGAYAVGLVWWAVVMLILAFLPPSARSLSYFLAALAGVGIATAHIIPWSMVPDVIEDDELRTGQRREGAFMGFLIFIQKTGTAFVLALVQWVLHLSGYSAGAEQPPAALLAIRMLIGPFPAALLVLSILLAWRFPINRVKHAELRARLAEQRLKDTSTAVKD